jgi:hypothetical protein
MKQVAVVLHKMGSEGDPNPADYPHPKKLVTDVCIQPRQTTPFGKG